MVKHRSTPLLLRVLILVTGIVALTSFALLFHSSYQFQRDQLILSVERQAAFIGSMLPEHESLQLDLATPLFDNIKAMLLLLEHQGLANAYALGVKQGAQLVIPLHAEEELAGLAKMVALSGETDAYGEALRRGVKGESGSLVARDFRDQWVLVAYAPLGTAGAALIGRVDLLEMAKPFAQTGLLVLILALVLIFVSARFFRRVTQPLLEQHQHSESRYRNLLDNMADCVAVYDCVEGGENFLIVDVNKAAEQFHGVEREQISGQQISEALPRVAKSGLSAALRRVWESGESEFVSLTYSDGSGRARWVENFIYRLGSGEVVVIYSDLTEQRQKEAQLKRSEHLLRSIVDATPDWIFIKDASFKYLFANRSFAEAVGHKPDSVIGKTDEDLGFPPEIVSGDAANGIRGFRKDDVDVLGGKRIHNPYDPATYQDGSFHIFDTHKIPLRDSTGKVYGVLAVARDITALNRAMGDLKVNEARLTLAEAIAHMGHWSWDIKHNKLFWSEEVFRIFGVVPGGFDSTYEAFLNFVHEEDRALVKLKFNAHLEENQPFSVDHRIVWRNGTVRWIHQEAELDRDADGFPDQMLGVVIDITDRKLAEQSLVEERNFLQHVINGISDPLRVIDQEMGVMLMNGAALDQSVERGDCEGKATCYQSCQGMKPLCDEYPDGMPACPLKRVIKTKQPQTETHLITLDDGEQRTYESSFSPLLNEEKIMYGVVETSRDITEHLGLQARLQEQDDHVVQLTYLDQLTGLPNRLLFMDRLRQGLSISRRDNRSLAVLYIDLDRFKQINESFGHEFGDLILQDVARRLQGQLREGDTLARFSGDEFVAVTGNLGQPEHAGILAQKLLQGFDEPFFVKDQKFYVTASIGVSIFPQDGQDPEALMREANTALFQAKDEGRNSFQFYRDEMTVQAFEHVLMENNLRNALMEQQFEIYYQPQVSFDTGEVVGAEALIRWNFPEMGMVSPAKFIPLAEDTGLILPIGEWVTRTTCQQIVDWLKRGIPVPRIAINLSPKQFNDKHLLENIIRILDETGCPSEQIEFEVTEGQIMERSERAIGVLEALRKNGITVAIDDFGTGYSSLSQLKQLPLNKLKIDHSFVRDLPDDMDSRAIAEAIIGMGRSLGLSVTAEGIENQAQAEFLQSAGCTQAQGFLYQRPVPAAEFEKFLLDSQADLCLSTPVPGAPD